MRVTRRTVLKWGLTAGGAACVLGVYAVWVERYLVRFPHYRIPVPNLPLAFSGMQIAHITDLHYGPLVPSGFVKGLFEKVKSLDKDLVVCTGDYIHERNATTQIDTVWPLLSRISAPLGVFSVLGNHDHWGNTQRSLDWLEKSGQNLRGKVVVLERNGQRLWFVGGGDLWEDHIPLDSLLKQIPGQECRIVLAHNPDSADKDRLYLSRAALDGLFIRYVLTAFRRSRFLNLLLCNVQSLHWFPLCSPQSFQEKACHFSPVLL